jgi:hypothetical protein
LFAQVVQSHQVCKCKLIPNQKKCHPKLIFFQTINVSLQTSMIDLLKPITVLPFGLPCKHILQNAQTAAHQHWKCFLSSLVWLDFRQSLHCPAVQLSNNCCRSADSFEESQRVRDLPLGQGSVYNSPIPPSLLALFFRLRQ